MASDKPTFPSSLKLPVLPEVLNVEEIVWFDVSLSRYSF